jgi:phosphohistidine phosphatase
MKRLLVMRHGKSDWGGDAPDHERPLNERGRASARIMGKVLSRMGQVPQLVYSSTALRARSTVELASRAGHWSTDIELVEDLYGSSPGTVLDIVARAARATRFLMIVGHQPTWGDLIEELTGARVQVKTGAVIGIDLAIMEWDKVRSGRAELAYVLQPRLFLEGTWDDLTR